MTQAKTASTESYIDLHDFSIEPIDTKVFCLLKVGRKAHMESLAQGKLFCHHLSYYKKSEFQSEAFFDQHEGLLAVLQADRVKLKFSSPTIGEIEKELDPGTQMVLSVDLHSPTFCLHAIHSGEWTHKEFPEEEVWLFKEYLQVPDEMEKFRNQDEAPYVCVLNDGNAFFDRVKVASEKENLGITGDLVKYVDLVKCHGSVANHRVGFVKQSRYKNEREYRIIFRGQHLSDPFQIDLGDLRDISQLMPLQEFKEKWELGFK